MKIINYVRANSDETLNLMAVNIYDICFSPDRPASKEQQNLNILRAIFNKKERNYMQIQKLELSIMRSFFVFSGKEFHFLFLYFSYVTSTAIKGCHK